jgi:hypothetical protein
MARRLRSLGSEIVMPDRRRSPDFVSAVRPSMRIAYLLVALTALMMPSSYRGGADLPHPHAFFQFWVAHHHDPLDHHRHHGDHRPVAGSVQARTAPFGDTPALLDAAAPFERSSLMALLIPAVASPLWLRWRSASPFVGARVLAGRIPVPDPPPPRLSMASA